MKRPPKHAPKRIQSTADLRLFQRMMGAAVTRPLTSADGLQSKWIDGRPMDKVAAEFVKPNDRMSSFERLELYNRMYWFRLFDAIQDDCPGLRAALGERAFWRLAQAYLEARPSRSFTLRNLCSRLVDFIVDHPRLTAPRTALAVEVARFEWAQTVAFDGEALPVVSASDFGKRPASRIRMGLQPYVTLLDLKHPIDTFVISVKRRQVMRSEASNTPGSSAPAPRAARKPSIPRRSRTFVAVHRHNNRLFYKRLDPAAYRILDSLSRGQSLERAVAAAGPKVKPAQVRKWFTTWMALGWFCSAGNKRPAKAS